MGKATPRFSVAASEAGRAETRKIEIFSNAPSVVRSFSERLIPKTHHRQDSSLTLIVGKV
jgi:hypothetical protein